MKKKGPALLLIVLIVILVFILGVRYGQRVEQTNEKTIALLSVAPTRPQPTEIPLKFLTYDGTACGLKFLYPSHLEIMDETASSASLFDQDIAVAHIFCKSDSFFGKSEWQKKFNPQTGKNVYYQVMPDLLPLIESSSELILPPSPAKAPAIASPSAN